MSQTYNDLPPEDDPEEQWERINRADILSYEAQEEAARRTRRRRETRYPQPPGGGSDPNPTRGRRFILPRDEV